MVSQRVLKIFRLLLFFVFDLIVLGAAVRAFNAGLACPDWPLCFGDVIPDYHPQVYFEFVHRVLAGAIALLFFGLAWVLWRNPMVSGRVKGLMALAAVVLIAQIIMGGLTVLKLLHANVVTAHLILGMSFLAILYWTYDDLRQVYNPEPSTPVSTWAILQSLVVLLAVVAQIVLGGLVASNYAGNVCAGFPLCNGQWVPTLSGPLGLQVIHRFGAYTIVLLVLATDVVFHWLRSNLSPGLMRVTRQMSYLVIAQLSVGIANVLLQTPAIMTILHSGLAALLLLTAVNMFRKATAYISAPLKIALVPMSFASKR